MKKLRSLGSQIFKAQILVVLTFLLFLVAVYFFFLRAYADKVLAMNTTLVQQTVRNSGENLADIDRIMEAFCYDAPLQSYLGTSDAYQRSQVLSQVRRSLINAKSMTASLDGILVRDAAGICLKDTSFDLPEVQALLESSRGQVFSTFFDETGMGYVVLQRPIYKIGAIQEELGTCYFVLEAKFLTDNLQNVSLDPSASFFLLDRSHTVLVSSDPAAVGKRLPRVFAPYLGMGQSAAGRDVAVTGSIGDGQLSVLSVTPVQVLLNDLYFVRVFSVLVCALGILCLSLIYSFVHKKTAKSALRMVEEIEKIAGGAAESISVNEDNREFHQLSVSINGLLVQLEAWKRRDLDNQQKLYHKELESRDAQLLALRSQINPHFLYNTLECINSMGAVYGSLEIQEMAVSLAAIFQYAIRGGHLVALRQEIEIVEAYLRIQHIRFAERLSVRFDISPALQRQQIVKFILQPLVENSIRHGLETSMKTLHICVAAAVREECLCLSVTDDGGGMPPQRLAQLRAQLARPQAGPADGIGLANIDRRLRLYYGPQYGVVLQSEMGRGTCVSLRLPLRGAATRKEGQAGVERAFGG